MHQYLLCSYPVPVLYRSIPDDKSIENEVYRVLLVPQIVKQTRLFIKEVTALF
jgi:hypothetical protein